MQAYRKAAGRTRRLRNDDDDLRKVRHNGRTRPRRSFEEFGNYSGGKNVSLCQMKPQAQHELLFEMRE